jgi:nicotinamidase-related amidase
MVNQTLAQQAGPFLDEIERWMGSLPALSLAHAMPHPERAAIVSVDVINGFCYEGPLSSPRVAGIVRPIRELFQAGWERGVRQIVLVQDTHDPHAVEFNQWPPHCVRGTSEAETVQEFKDLPFYGQMLTLEKNSIHAGLNTGLETWLGEHPELDTFIVVGDCTDLCTYQLAMFLRLRANALQLNQRVIVPVDTVDTYDLPVEAARQAGILPHPGNVLHAVFLYHMALNGVEVVKEVCP